MSENRSIIFKEEEIYDNRNEPLAKEKRNKIIKEMHQLNDKIEEFEKTKANHYHVFAVCDDISKTFKKVKKNIKTDKEKDLYDILYKDYTNLIKEYEEIRGGAL